MKESSKAKAQLQVSPKFDTESTGLQGEAATLHHLRVLDDMMGLTPAQGGRNPDRKEKWMIILYSVSAIIYTSN